MPELEAAHRRQDRSSRAQRTGIYGVVYQAVYAGIQLTCLGLLVRSTSADVFGLWMTILALTTWAPVASAGQPAALLTKLGAVAMTDSGQARRILSASMAIVAGLAGVLLVALLATAPTLSWARLLNANTQATLDLAQRATLVALSLVIVAAPATMAGFAILAHQRGDVVHLAMIAGAALCLVLCGAAVWSRQSILVSGAAMMTGPLLGGVLLWALAAWGRLGLLPRWRDVDKQTLRLMLGAGAFFLLTDAAHLAIVRTPELIVAHLHGPTSVGLFSSVGRLPLLMLAVFQAIMIPYWPALGEAVQRGDEAWVRQVVKRSLLTLLGVCSAAVLAMALFGGAFVRAWLGSNDPSIPTLVAAACVQSVGMAMLAWLSVMLGALSLFRQQVGILALTAALYVPTAIAFGHRFGPPGVALAQACLLLLFAAPLGAWVLSTRLRSARLRQRSSQG